MDNSNRPHSRQKTVGSGSAHVSAGKPVNTGSRPVGTGTGRKTTSGGGRSGGSSSGGQRALPGKLNLKTILIIVAVLVIGAIVLKGFGGNSGDDPGYDDPGYSDTTTQPGSNDKPSAGQSSYSDADTNVSKLARTKYVTPAGGGNDKITIMVYMCGTDLESKYGMATKDLNEMLAANLSDKINLIIETGGCNRWQNNKVSSSCNQIFKIENKRLNPLVENAGTLAMTNPTNLTKFIEYCTTNYPADRNMLIFWDHGGGSISGYGYDEKNSSEPSMTLGRINTALSAAKCQFDFIGFDACLMATLENALVCEQYADYLIASEETEPGTGWYYTNWLNALAKNTSMPTVNIAKNIIDDFVSSCGSASVTLSVIDLAELSGTVPEAFNDFAASTCEMIKNDNYQQVAEARQGVRQFSPKNRLNQVDLIDLAQRINTTESKKLAAALKGCVKYNKTTMSRSNGVSIYFPYENTSSVKSAVASYKELGLDSEYADCIKSFASLGVGGQLTAAASQQSSPISGDLLSSLLGNLLGGGTTSSSASSPIGSIVGGLIGGGSSSSSPIGSIVGSLLGGGSSSSVSPVTSLLGSLVGGGSSSSSATSPIGALLGSFIGGGSSSSHAAGNSINASSVIQLLSAFSGRSMPSEYDWLDADLIAANAQNISENYIDPSHLVASEKDGKKVLALSEEEWSLISTAELNVFVGDENGYIDLGLDNVFEFTDEGDLLLEYDGTWLTLNDNVCAYYLVSDTEYDDGSWVTVGRIPAMLNDSYVNLNVVFDDDHPQGVVTGAYPMYVDLSGVQAKGDIEITAGDTIQLLCDYYSADGETCVCTLGDPFEVPQSGLSLINLALDNTDVTAAYRLTDIYGSSYWVTIDD